LRDGDDVLLLPLGPMVEPALQAAQRLHESGLSAAVVNPRFVKPLDRSLIPDLARRIRRVITIEEHMLAGGFGSAILELFAELHLTDVEVVRLGVPDLLVEQGNPAAIRARFGLSSDGIQAAAEALVNGRTVARLRGEGVG
jgi:1-deoxy-D-xylulose-5-phosphate synthase